MCVLPMCGTPVHDDENVGGGFARAAACYAIQASVENNGSGYANDVELDISRYWPFGWFWWKPTTPRRDLIKAAALIVAEIERLDRKENPDA